jgi:hypothetical protein
MDPAKLAYRIMRPSTDGQVISREDLAVKSHPSEEPTLLLCMSLPRFGRTEGSDGAHELASVSRGSGVDPRLSPSPPDGVRPRQ